MMRRDRYPLDMPRLAAAMALACAFALAGAPARVAAADLQAKVDEPRAFGHTIGDVLTQRILLTTGDHDLGRVELPSAGRVDVWLERRAARLETDAEGRRWMILDYQVTNSPRDITRIALPALALKTAAGDVLHVPEWPASVGPLVPDAGTDAAALRAMQPDRAVPPTALAPIARRLAVTLALLAATLVAWAMWWVLRNRREAARLPFAVAWRQMRRLGASEKESDAAWRALHRALNETAGRVVHAGSLAVLFLRAPWLLPLRPRIEQFYRQSEARFFAVVGAGDETRPSAHAQANPVAASDAGRDVEAGSSGDISHITDVGDGIGGARGGASRGLVALSRALFLAERRRHR
jgi:mxaA protein